jgi:hypothetical protein
MIRPFYRTLPLLLFLLLGATVHCPTAAAQAAPVKGLRLYSRRLHGFYRIGTDSATIIAYNSLKVTVRHPQAFLLGLHQALARRPAPAGHLFGYDDVRLLYVITYADGRIERVQMDAARTILWQHKLFIADSMETLLLAPLTRKQRLAVALAQRSRF